MDSAVATCLKAVTVPSVVPIQWTKSVDLFFCFFCPHPCPSNIPSPPLPSHWAPVFESCSLSRLTELTKSKEGIWRWVGVGHGKKKKRTKWWSEREESRGGAQRRRKARRLHCVTPIGDINGKGKRLLPSCFWRTLALHLIPPAQLGKGHSALFLTMTALFLFQNNAS